MSDDTLNPNLEWKKKGFGKKEKPSRRIDANQASLSEQKQKNNFTGVVSLTAQSSVSFDHHLKKMRKKIKQALDEDEEDDETSQFFGPLDIFLEDELNANPLFKGLNEAEKSVISQKRTLEQIRMQQDASKVKALTNINAFAKRAGLEPLTAKEFGAHMQNNGWGQDTFKMALEQNITPNIKTGWTNIDQQKAQKLMKGLKRLQKMGNISAVDGMKMDEVIKITDNKFNDEKVAKLLLKKTGRSLGAAEKKRISHQQQKISFKDLVQQKQQKKQISRELS